MAQTRLLKGLICGSAIALLAWMPPDTPLAHGGGEGAALMIGGYQVSPVFAEPAKAGENLLHVQILDGTGSPVTGARVEIIATPVENAHAHPDGMAGMESGAHEKMGEMRGMQHGMHGMQHGMRGVNPAPAAVPAKEVQGEYVGVITFSAAGHWLVNTHFSIDGQMLRADFPVEVADGSSSLGIAILIAFIGLNAFIIWTASVTRHKPVSA